MHSWTGCVALEGTPTIDNRLIVPGALNWDPPFPFLDTAGNSIGQVVEVWREGDKIMAKGSVGSWAAGEKLTVGISIDRVTGGWTGGEGDEPGVWTVSAAKILGLALSDEPTWDVVSVQVEGSQTEAFEGAEPIAN